MYMYMYIYVYIYIGHHIYYQVDTHRPAAVGQCTGHCFPWLFWSDLGFVQVLPAVDRVCSCFEESESLVAPSWGVL